MVHKHKIHELTITRTLSKASGLFEFINFCLPGMLADSLIYMIILTAVTNFISFLLSKILHVAFLLPVSILTNYCLMEHAILTHCILMDSYFWFVLIYLV